MDGGNCFVAETGVYMIYVDVENKKVCVEPAKVYGIGNCFGGWDEAMEGALFTAADGKLSITVPNADELRLYAASSIATTAWWTREFIILDGKIAYRGNGGDQPDPRVCGRRRQGDPRLQRRNRRHRIAFFGPGPLTGPRPAK